MRRPKPFYRTQTGCFYVQLDGSQGSLVQTQSRRIEFGTC
jgi:hypothetical protein